MKKDLLDSTIRVADLHVKYLNFAKNRLSLLMPFLEDKISALNEEEFLILELFFSRFCKLYNLMRLKLIDQIIEYSEEQEEYITFIDKLNKLEKLGVIEDVKKWKSLKEIYDYFMFEYSEDPAKTAKYINIAFELTSYMMLSLENIKKFSNRISKLKEEIIANKSQTL